MITADDPAVSENLILMPPFRSEGVACWIARLPTHFHALTDSNEEPHRSRLRLFENGRELGPAHAVHDTIRRRGGGSYSFWVDILYFSTSDNTDPNTNGRSYSAALVPLRYEHTPSQQELAPHQVPWVRPERPLRCALFGVGNRGVGLAKLTQGFEGVEIAWVVDCSEDRIAAALDALGNPGTRGTTEIWRPLADPSVDAVFVTVPDHLHRQIAEPAFLARKHVFLEKPLATTATDAKAIVSAWRESGGILQLGYVLRQDRGGKAAASFNSAMCFGRHPFTPQSVSWFVTACLGRCGSRPSVNSSMCGTAPASCGAGIARVPDREG